MIYFQSQVDRLLAEKTKQVEILEKEIDRLRTEINQESIRANNAIDQLLSKSGSFGVTPQPSREKSKVESLIESVSHHLGSIGEDVGEEPKEDKVHAGGK